MRYPQNEIDRRRFLRQLLGLSGVAAITLASPRAFAATSIRIHGMRLTGNGSDSQVIFELSGSVQHNIFTLKNPDRLVIDFRNAHLTRGLRIKPNALVRDVRYAKRHFTDSRIVLDLNAEVNPASHLLGPGQGGRGYRLIVDLANTKTQPLEPVLSAAAVRTHDRLRDVVVFIDPGHGGKDPGAIGKHGTYEKHVVLDIARRFEALVQKTPGMRAVMSRKGDYFITLSGRVRRARAHRADLFVSIHADASPYRYPKGSTVYVLSEHGASSEAARLLAKRQNSVDRIAGIDLSTKNSMVASVLVDLAQTAAIESSFKLGENLTQSISGVIRLHSRNIERAAFVVLKSPDFPSALVETAFISNPAEERQLRTPAFRRHMAEALHRGIEDYFRRYAPSGTQLAARNRVLQNFT